MVPFFEDHCPKSIKDKNYRNKKCGYAPLMGAYFTFHNLPLYDDQYMEALTNWVEGKFVAPNYLLMGIRNFCNNL